MLHCLLSTAVLVGRFSFMKILSVLFKIFFLRRDSTSLSFFRRIFPYFHLENNGCFWFVRTTLALHCISEVTK